MDPWRSESARASWLTLLWTAAMLVLVLSLTGCTFPGSGDQDDTDSTEPVVGGETSASLPDSQTEATSTTVAADGTIALNVYFTQNEKMAAATRMVPQTSAVGAAAMEALLEGPTSEEKEARMFSAIPEDTTYLGLSIDDGVATVDLSQEYASGGGSLTMFTRLAQVVFTLTQFPTVDAVRFKLDGELIDTFGGEGIVVNEPLSRADYENMSPAILVESPTVGATVSSPLRVFGTANVFEAVFQINIVDWDGLIIAEKTVTASSGSGTRGTFDVTIPFEVSEPGLGALIVFAESPKDGSQTDVVEIPLHLTE